VEEFGTREAGEAAGAEAEERRRLALGRLQRQVEGLQRVGTGRGIRTAGEAQAGAGGTGGRAGGFRTR